MAYRDPTDAIRQRVELRREDVQSRGQRITDELIRQLPPPLRQELESSRQEAFREANDIQQWREVEQALERYAAAIEQIYQLAPMLDERFQEIKRGYCKRIRPRHYAYPDIYDTAVERLRARIHDKLRALDPKVRLLDTAPEYFNTSEHPLLIDAQLRVRRMPVNLAVHGVMLNNNNQAYQSMTVVGFQATCNVPRGLANMEIVPQGAGDAALQWVGLQKDTRTDDELFDRAFRVRQPADPAVARILGSGVRRALRLLHSDTLLSHQLELPQLVVQRAVARVAWLERGHHEMGLEPALELLRQLRRTSPPVLLREPAS